MSTVGIDVLYLILCVAGARPNILVERKANMMLYNDKRYVKKRQSKGLGVLE